MNTRELKEKFEENNEIIKKLRDMLKTSNNKANTKLIMESIDKVLEEQNNISRNLRKNIYGDLRKKANSLMMNKIEDKTEVLTSSKKVQTNDDITEVLTSDMKKEEDNKIIDYEDEIIEVNDFIDDNKDKTEVLKKPEEEVKEKFDYKSIKIVFDGTYKIYRNKDGVLDCIYEYNLDEDTLKRNYEINGTYDFNIITMLKQFDSENDTKLYDRYMSNKIPVHYDLLRAKRDYNTSKTNMNRLTTIIGREQEDKEFTNVTVRNPKKSKFRVMAATIAVAALTLIGSIGISKKLSNNEKLVNANDKSVSNTLDVNDAGVTDANYEDVKIEETSMINSDLSDIELVEAKEDEEVAITPLEDVVKEDTSIRVGDTYKFTNDVDLYYASTDTNPNGSTSYLGDCNYEVNLISVVDDGKVVEVIDNDDVSVNELRETYGEDVEIFVNGDHLTSSNDLVTKHVGWIEVNELESKGKVLVK